MPKVDVISLKSTSVHNEARNIRVAALWTVDFRKVKSVK